MGLHPSRAQLCLESADHDRVDVTLRPMEPSDRACVISTWMRSAAERVRGQGPRRAFFAYEPRLAERVIDSAQVLIACSPEHASTIHGWCATSAPGVVHYAYVPRELRRLGLAREMIRSALGSYPDRIETGHRWPWASSRFVFVHYHAGVAA